MNVYGFLKDTNVKLWSRKDGPSTLFHRDHPQNLDMIKPRRPKSAGKSKKAAKAQKAADSAAVAATAATTTKQSERTTTKAPPEGALKALFCFLEVCSASHPSLIGWNSAGTAFFMEVYHPDVQALLHTYFPAMKKQPIQLLKAYGFSRDG